MYNNFINVFAIDKGTAYTKTSNMISFKSTIREYKNHELNFSQDKIIVEYQNKKYVIGENGKTNTNLFKSLHEETKLLVLTGIALSNPTKTKQIINLVTGLPIGRMGYEGEKMRNLFQYTNNEIIINNKKYNINIGKTEIFPEGASSFYYLQDTNEGLIIDIGGLTIDTALFIKDKKLNKYSTYRLGILPLYRQLANHIGSKYSLTLDEWSIQEILQNGLSINGKVVQLKISHIVDSYIQQIIQALEFDYNIPSINNIFITGGGGIFLYPYIKEKIPRINIINTSVFSNVLAYQLLGEVLFNEEG